MTKINMIMLAAVMTAVCSCTGGQKKYAIEAAGLDKCVLSSAKRKAGSTRDITRVEFGVTKECRPRFFASLDKSAGPRCHKLLVDSKGCYYEYNGVSVMIHDIGDGSLYSVQVY